MFPDFLNQLKGNNIVALMNCHICCCLLFLFFFSCLYGFEIWPVLFTKSSQFHFSNLDIKTIEAYQGSKIEML